MQQFNHSINQLIDQLYSRQQGP